MLMKTASPSKPARAPVKRRRNGRQGRRSIIVAALRKLIMEKGYAEISLTELAQVAGMSVSHLLYYFASKEAALAELCDNVVEGILSHITSHLEDPPEERIHMLVDHLFLHGVVPREELGIVWELIALSIHKPQIRKKLREYNETMMAYLVDLFEKVPRQRGVSARDSADIAAAVWMGFFTNSAYDELVSNARARQLFRRSLLGLANIRDSAPTTNFSPLARKSA
jgi:AcrR family transcriptional regulator